MNDFEIEIVNKILKELHKPKKLRNWEENNLKTLHRKAMEALSKGFRMSYI